jgi:AraC family transcriptional regulator of adaptative response/methylated-DNA-[protein]-cysteine methyltransferase
VIQSTGTFGGYMWGNTRKTAIIGWEGVQTNPDLNQNTP